MTCASTGHSQLLLTMSVGSVFVGVTEADLWTKDAKSFLDETWNGSHEQFRFLRIKVESFFERAGFKSEANTCDEKEAYPASLRGTMGITGAAETDLIKK